MPPSELHRPLHISSRTPPQIFFFVFKILTIQMVFVCIVVSEQERDNDSGATLLKAVTS